MSIIALLPYIALFGVIVWPITLLPMPPIFRNVIIGVAVILLILWLLGAVGGVALPTL